MKSCCIVWPFQGFVSIKHVIISWLVVWGSVNWPVDEISAGCLAVGVLGSCFVVGYAKMLLCRVYRWLLQYAAVWFAVA